jgi:hypothetical protein
LLVTSESRIELLVLWILLDGADGSNGGSLGSNLVLESNREQVSLLGGEIFVLGLNYLSKVFNHVVESLGLLSDSSHEDALF